MQNLFERSSRDAILARLAGLSPAAPRHWGKMDPGQMMAHCSAALEMAAGERPGKQSVLGLLLGRFVKPSLLGEKPFSRNSPTDPSFVVTDEKDFTREKQRLTSLVDRFCDAGPDRADGRVHSFLGKLRGEEWGVMMFKHLDHHLRQFGA